MRSKDLLTDTDEQLSILLVLIDWVDPVGSTTLLLHSTSSPWTSRVNNGTLLIDLFSEFGDLFDEHLPKVIFGPGFLASNKEESRDTITSSAISSTILQRYTHNASFMYANENLLVLSAKVSSSLLGNLMSGLLDNLSCQYIA